MTTELNYIMQCIGHYRTQQQRAFGGYKLILRPYSKFQGTFCRHCFTSVSVGGALRHRALF